MVLMIIKGLFRRYERWNPVHPTSGAFWGMGIGVGCGVGWGPGFGPEVIGYVGAGCGVGFNVGITLAGFGIGLPANGLIEAPYNALVATSSSALEFARSQGLLSIRNVAGDGWNNIAPRISGWKREASGRFSSFKNKNSLDNGVDSFDAKSIISVHTRSILERLGTFSGQFFQPRKGLYSSYNGCTHHSMNFSPASIESGRKKKSFVHTCVCQSLVLSVELAIEVAQRAGLVGWPASTPT